MAIIETLTTTRVAVALLQDDYANWTYDGALALAEYLENLSNVLGQDMELDVVAIRGEYSEYSLEELVNNYSRYFEWMTDDEKEDINLVIEALEDYTTVLKVNDDTIIIAEF